MERRVAVKLLKPHLTSDATQLQRFAREARSTLKVESPHAVKVLDFGVTPQRDYYMVLEYLDGRTVQRELDVDGPFSPARTVHVARQALHALGAAHQRGLVHRDVKPDNLLLMRAGADPDYTKVLDFGVAKLMEGAPRSDQSALALTQVGMVFGTPEFMSPEQACGHPLDGRSDLYSLAATMFAMMTGCGLFENGSPIEWLTHHARTPPPHLAMAQPGLAAYPELDELLQRCLAKQRDRRPKDAEEMERLLAALVPTLSRAPGAPPPKSAAAVKSTFSSSSFLDALPPETVDPGETLRPPLPGSGVITAQERPGQAATPVPEEVARAPTVQPGVSQELPVPTGSTNALPRGGGRGRMLVAVGAIVAVTLIGVAIGFAVTRRTSRAAPGPGDAQIGTSADDAGSGAPAADAAVQAPPPPPPADARPLPAPADAGSADGPPIDAGMPVRPPRTDAGVPVRPPRTDAGSGRPPSSRKAVVEAMKEAEAALRTNNRLMYLHWSKTAYDTDPQDVPAALMYADALIRSGNDNKDRGCKLLRTLKRVPAAQKQADAAGCPTD
jgi:serine/threonine-protein kinase